MDATDALGELIRVSEEVRAAVVFERGGNVLAATVPDRDAAEAAGIADAMLAYAATLRPTVAVRQARAVTPDGDVYVATDGNRGVVAVASPGSLAGLVRHDLRTLLGSLTTRRRKALVGA